MLYTLKYGEILSKPFAAEWAKENLDPRWTASDRTCPGSGGKTLAWMLQPEDIHGTLDMMRIRCLQQMRTPAAISG